MQKKMDISISDLVGDYLCHISKYSSNNYKSNVVDSYQELEEALDAGMEDIKQGRYYTHNEMKEHWKTKMRNLLKNKKQEMV